MKMKKFTMMKLVPIMIWYLLISLVEWSLDMREWNGISRGVIGVILLYFIFASNERKDG